MEKQRLLNKDAGKSKVYIKVLGAVTVNTEHDLRLLQNKTKEEGKSKIQHRVTLTAYPVPDGLRMVACLRNEIKKLALNIVRMLKLLHLLF
ncbi:hypothetical protein QR674_10545 [Acinetobacter chinensis]|uniref:Uncharacterized protein n=1 Tax=Acinetobacter chinensis TaxID=2004650 RepID=A0ABU3WG87_9GAMM|nr:hypothetical protein [Acinetobacter chinensis]MDV2469426.1 hypothetical protein [Acinetobacter chinensis]